ncbi:MAG TPA: glutathione S-transferase family protein [bacterium]|nr:glutathione S-transferase family protein [bacterium]
MKLHAHKVSTTSRPVLLFIKDNKIDCEFVEVDLMTGEHMKPPFTDMNPSKQVPVLQDGDFVLTESSSILKYLAEKTGSPTYPKDLKARARVNEAMDWLNTGFYREYGYHLIYPQVFPNHERTPDVAQQATLEWGRSQCDHWLGVLDQHWLGKGNAYLCGNEKTVADYMGAEFTDAGCLIGANYNKYPNVKRWMDSMKSLPAWSEVNDVAYGFAESLKGKPFVTIQ